CGDAPPGCRWPWCPTSPPSPSRRSTGSSSAVAAGQFDQTPGQTELIRGRIVHMNPQGPEHADPIDFLAEWSFHVTQHQLTVRVEKPIRLVDQHSCPEPDIAWVTRRRYHDRHPNGDEVKLLIEVSKSSNEFDRSEKMLLYANAAIAEYWQIDLAARVLTVFRGPIDGRYRFKKTYEGTQVVHPHDFPNAILHVSDLFPPS
ncbi:MAG: Uma2 family endonuclease, partial [Planctomycetota bacterium]